MTKQDLRDVVIPFKSGLFFEFKNSGGNNMIKINEKS
mgnify:CR=1 FL=1